MLNAAVRLHQIAPSGIVIAVRHRTCRSAKYTRCKGVRRFGLDIPRIIVRPNVGFVERAVVLTNKLPQHVIHIAVLHHARRIGDLRDVAVIIVAIIVRCTGYHATVFTRFYLADQLGNKGCFDVRDKSYRRDTTYPLWVLSQQDLRVISIGWFLGLDRTH